MADDLFVTEGSGTRIAADELSINSQTVKVQRVKQVLGADGTYTADLAGRAVSSGVGAAFVDPRPSVVRLQVTPTISAASAYALKDAVGGLLTFSNAARTSGVAFRVDALQIVDKDQERAALDLILFDRTFTTPTDNNVFDPTDAELLTCVGGFSVTAADYADFNDNSVASLTDLGLVVVPNGTDLFGVLVARSTPTYTSTSDLVVTLTITQF